MKTPETYGSQSTWGQKDNATYAHLLQVYCLATETKIRMDDS